MRLKRGLYGGRPSKEEGKSPKLRDHLIIVGFGFNGRNLAHAAKVSGIPYGVIEMNPRTVKDEREKGENIFYGDASHGAVLEQVNIRKSGSVNGCEQPFIKTQKTSLMTGKDRVKVRPLRTLCFWKEYLLK